MSPRTLVTALFCLAALPPSVWAHGIAPQAAAQTFPSPPAPASPLSASDYAAGYASMNSQGLFGRSVSTTTDTGGVWTVAWQKPLIVPPANVQATARAAGVYCAVTSATVNGASGACFGLRALPGSITLLTQLQNYSVQVTAPSVQVDVAAQATNDPAGS